MSLSGEIKIEKGFTNIPINIIRNGDFVKFNKISISKNFDINEIDKLVLHFRNYQICVSFRLLVMVSKIIDNNNNWIIDVNNDVFLRSANNLIESYGFPLISMQYSPVCVELISKNNIDYKIEFLFTFVDCKLHNNLTKCTEILLNESLKYTSQNEIIIYGLITEIFIETDNILLNDSKILIKKDNNINEFDIIEYKSNNNIKNCYWIPIFYENQKYDDKLEIFFNNKKLLIKNIYIIRTKRMVISNGITWL